MPLPQIIIEDPEGEVQCSECCKKSGEIKKLKENIEEVKLLLSRIDIFVRRTSFQQLYEFAKIKK